MKPERCLVVEDAPNGIRSGNAAGCKTLGLLTTHSPQQVAETTPDYTVKDLSRWVLTNVSGISARGTKNPRQRLDEDRKRRCRSDHS